MARIETDPNYSSPTFSRATAATDLFKKEDVQALAAAVSTHDHTSGKGVLLTASSIPTGLITSAMIADGTVTGSDLAPNAIDSTRLGPGAAHVTAITTSLSAESTTSSTFVTLPNTTLSATTVAGSDFIVIFVGGFIASNASSVPNFSLTMDGGAFPGLTRYTAPAGSFAHPVTMIARYQPSAGAHSWTVGWQIVSGGSVQTDVGVYRTLLGIELRRANA